MNQRAGNCAVACRGVRNRQVGRSRGSDIEIRVPKLLVRQSSESDLLVTLANRESLSHWRRSVVIRVAGLQCCDGARPDSKQMNQGPLNCAVPAGLKNDGEVG